jgi:hypothetical protein
MLSENASLTNLSSPTKNIMFQPSDKTIGNSTFRKKHHSVIEKTKPKANITFGEARVALRNHSRLQISVDETNSKIVSVNVAKRLS